MNSQRINAETDAETLRIIAAYREDVADRNIRVRYRLQPESFYRALGASNLTRISAAILRLMLRDSDCCRYLCGIEELPAATEAGRKLFKADRYFNVRLAREAVEWTHRPGKSAAVKRALSILAGFSNGSRLNNILVQLGRAADRTIRLKAIELLLPTAHDQWKVRSWVEDPDPRVRANLIIAAAKLDPRPSWVELLLTENLTHEHGRVAANAAVGLYYLGSHEPAITTLKTMAQAPSAARRSSAAWAMGQLANEDWSVEFRKLRFDESYSVRGNALKSLLRIKKQNSLRPHR